MRHSNKASDDRSTSARSSIHSISTGDTDVNTGLEDDMAVESEVETHQDPEKWKVSALTALAEIRKLVRKKNGRKWDSRYKLHRFISEVARMANLDASVLSEWAKDLTALPDDVTVKIMELETDIQMAETRAASLQYEVSRLKQELRKKDEVIQVLKQKEDEDEAQEPNTIPVVQQWLGKAKKARSTAASEATPSRVPDAQTSPSRLSACPLSQSKCITDTTTADIVSTLATSLALGRLPPMAPYTGEGSTSFAEFVKQFEVHFGHFTDSQKIAYCAVHDRKS